MDKEITDYQEFVRQTHGFAKYEGWLKNGSVWFVRDAKISEFISSLLAAKWALVPPVELDEIIVGRNTKVLQHWRHVTCGLESSRN